MAEWMKALKDKFMPAAKAMTPAQAKEAADLVALDKKDAATARMAAEAAEYTKRNKGKLTWSGAGGGNTGKALRNLGD